MYLADNPHKSVKEISNATNVGYKHTSKILKEFVDKDVIEKRGKLFFLKGDFINFIKALADTIMKNYSHKFGLRNKTDLYNVLASMYPEAKINKKVDKLMEDWLIKKLDEWYSKYYDFENKEYLKVEEIILKKFGKNINVLEVGCGTGRITFKLGKKFSKVTGLDKEDKYIKYCKKISKAKNIEFASSNLQEFNPKTKFDVVIFSWIGLHYYKDPEKVLKKTKEFFNKKGMLIILDAYHETEYVKILEMIRPFNLDQVKLNKTKLNELIIKVFGNLNSEILLTKYKFDSIEEVINNFKIELALEESHVWTKQDEAKIRDYLASKKDPLIIQEGLWVSVANSTN
jgi:ubiquinone/menaquinone biosynthesis C-methylase UbiE